MSKPGHSLVNASVQKIVNEAGFDHALAPLFCVPIRYDTQEPVALSSAKLAHGHSAILFKCIVATEPVQVSVNPPIFSMLATGRNGYVSVTGTAYLDESCLAYFWKEGTEVFLMGLPASASSITNAYPVSALSIAAQYKGKTKGVSKTTPGVVKAVFAPGLKPAVELIKTAFDDMPEKEILSYLNFNIDIKPFKSLGQFMSTLHFPNNEKDGGAAKSGAANLAALDCCFRAKRASHRAIDEQSVISIEGSVVADLHKKLPFKITKEQRAAMGDIWSDLRAPYPMNRLLSGDVGTGKTAVIGVMAAAAQSMGKKVVIFTPNGLLTEQFYGELMSWFGDIPVAKVTKDSKPDPSCLKHNPILIGTHAVVSWAKKHHFMPDFLVVDEQQKTSRDQREVLLGKHTNFLEATATCIPRTYALMAYGGMKLSVIRQQPVEKKITTKVIYNNDRSAIFDEIKKVVAQGNKVAIILPLVFRKDSEDIDIEADKLSVESATLLWEKAFPGAVVGLHGKMSEGEKIKRLESIKNTPEVSIIISTTIIEIGVTILNLRLMITVEPDRYGLSTLHQMRGRLARNGGEGAMYLLVKKPAEQLSSKTTERLALLERINDGFELAEADAQLRGWGDLAEDSSIQTGSVVTLFSNILIPQVVIGHVQSTFEKNAASQSHLATV